MTETYAETHDYGIRFSYFSQSGGAASEVDVSIGRIGSAFRGEVGGANMARPPWGWFDGSESELLGEWFFDPARVIKRHFDLGDDFSIVYVDRGFLGLFPSRSID